MLDKLLYKIDKGIFLAGSDWVVIGMFALIALVGLFCVVASRVERFRQAGIAIIILLILSYVPCVCFPSILESVYLHLGLITKTFLEMPFVLRFPTLWLPAILIPVGLWTLLALLSDWIRGKPITTVAIEEKRWYEAAEAEERILNPGQFH